MLAASCGLLGGECLVPAKVQDIHFPTSSFGIMSSFDLLNNQEPDGIGYKHPCTLGD